MAPLSTDMYLPALPEFQRDLGISTSMTQMTLTMTMIGMALGQIFGGPVSDRMGRRAPLFLGMAGFTLASLVCSLADDIYVFLIFRFAQGFFGAFGIVVSRAVARDTASGSELMRLLSVLMAVNGIAPVAAPVLGGQILLFSSWQGIFQILLLVGIIQIICTFNFKETLPPEKRSPDFHSGFSAFSMLLRDKYFFGHCLVQCFVFGSFFSYIAGSSFLFQNIYGVSAQVYSYIFGAVGLGLMVMGMLPARLAGTIREVVILRFSLFASLGGALFFLAGVFLDSPLWYAVVTIFATVTPLSLMSAASVSLALSRCGKNAGSGSALIGFFSMVLGGVMMPVVGVAGDHTAVPMAVIMVSGYVFSILCFYKMIVPRHLKELRG